MSRVRRAFCTTLWTLFVAAIATTNAQRFWYNEEKIVGTATWCTTSKAEQDKCLAFANAVAREISRFDSSYVTLKCKHAFNKAECMTMLDNGMAHLTTLDPGEVFTAGRYHSLVPIMQELVGPGSQQYEYAVTVVKKGTIADVQSVRDLRGKKACFAGVGTLAGWIKPLDILMKQGGLEVIDCNNHVKSAIKYFGPSCAVNSLVDRYNPLGDNSDKLCKLCIGKIPGERCTNSDPYAGYEGAFRCLVEVGEVAFLVHTTVIEMTSTNFDLDSVKKDQFELICPTGGRAPVDEYERCNWGRVPSRAIVTSSATGPQIRSLYQRFLRRSVEIFGSNFTANATDTNANRPNRQNYFGNRPAFDENDPEGHDIRWDGNSDGRSIDNGYNNNYYDEYGRETTTINYNGNSSKPSDDGQPIENFNMFESAPRHGLQHNLLFSDNARTLVPMKETDQTYSKYLGRALDSIMAVRRCTVHSMTLCVTSDAEYEKCIKMTIALKAQLLKPQLHCYKGHSQIHCMQAIQKGTADIAVMDASDVYTAGLYYEHIPFISESYNLGTPDYYVVAVAKESDPSTDLTHLKNKYTCHTGINMAAGWVYPLAFLMTNGWIRGYGCDSVHAAAEYFAKSCVPGALSTEYNIGVPYDNMCDLCHGASYRYCRRDASEDYFGHTGAFRCLVEGGGDVAFVKHTTVSENTDGKRNEWWARNTFMKDFQLLCPNGTRAPGNAYEQCNIGKVRANAIITRGGPGYNETQINAYINLFVYAQQFYGRKDADEFSFSMFSSPPPYSDLIFQDATQQLVVVPPEQREFSAYVGSDFMRARRITDCNAGASAVEYSVIASFCTIVVAFVLTR